MTTFRGTRTATSRWVGVAVSVAGFVLSAVYGAHALRTHGLQVDLAVYRMGAQAILHGRHLYDVHTFHPTLGFTYTEFAGIAAIPYTWVSIRTAETITVLVSLGSLCAIAFTSTRQLFVGHVANVSRQAWMACSFALAGLACWFEPVRKTIELGQINLILVALILFDLLIVRHQSRRGILVGIAAGIKLLPLLFIVYLAITKQRRAALNALATFAGTVAIGFAVQPSQSWKYWTRYIRDPRRIGHVSYVGNQSLLGATARLLKTVEPPKLLTTLFSAIAVAIAMYLAHRLHHAGRELDAVCAVAFGTLLASPISWNHHFVWVIPAVVVIVREVVQRRSVVVAIFAIALCAEFIASPIWRVPFDRPHEFTASFAQSFVANSYLLATIAFITLLASTLTSRDRSARYEQ